MRKLVTLLLRYLPLPPGRVKADATEIDRRHREQRRRLDLLRMAVIDARIDAERGGQ